MKKRILFIASIAMMFFAVQGYAQRHEGGVSRGQGQQRVEQRSSSRSSSYSRPSSRGNSTLERGASSRQQTSVTYDQNRGNRSNNRRSTPQVHNTRPETRGPQRGYYSPHKFTPSPPPVHNNYGNWRPVFGHHANNYHHHHRCIFDTWLWHSWAGYNNRFIRHGYYHDRFFDNLLGYYLWGSLNAPTRIDIGDLSITRYNSMLKIQIGNRYSTLNLYQNQKVRYVVGYTTVEVSTNYGYANIYLYDEYGNTATYRF